MGPGVALASGDAPRDRAPALPSGWVTFVFTDMVDSTRVLKALGDDADACFDRHDELLRAAWRRHGGHEINTEGDLFFVAFEQVGDAIAACATAQQLLADERWPGRAQIAVRMGIHAGYARPRDGDYRAIAVHQASRVVSAANGGQILVTSTALEHTTRSDVPRLVDLGRYRIRDFDEPERLYRVDLDELEPVTTAVRATPADRHNLLLPGTRFNGREASVAAVGELLEPGALVSVVGPGGIGKTRLALELAVGHLDSWKDGVWFVDLAELASSTFTATKVAEDLGVAVGPDTDATDALVARLAESEALIILDNTETHLQACVELTSRLLRSCRRIALLTTGREPLNLPVEWVHRLGPLEEAAAVDLFVDHARRVGVETELDPDLVRRVCERLDYVPLAIEIAASRASVMSMREMLDGLDDRFALLRSHDRSRPERHRTLSGLVDWSYRLLDDDERRVLRALSLFGAPFTRDAAAAAVGDQSIDPGEIPDLLWRLVDKSLVFTDTGDSGTRYRLTATVRLYAADRLRESGEETATALRLATWFLDRFAPEQAAAHRAWVGAVRPELANLRGLIPILAPSAQETAQGLAAIIGRHHRASQTIGPGIEDLEWLLDELPEPTPTRVALLTELADLMLHNARVDDARRFLDEASELADSTGEPEWAAGNLRANQGELAIRAGNPDVAVAIAEEGLAGGPPARAACRLWNLLGIGEFIRGNHERAIEAFRREVAGCEEIGDDSRVVVAQSNIAEVALQLGDRRTAAAQQALALELALESDQPAITAFSMMVCARLTEPAGDWERAAQLHAFGEHQLELVGHRLYDAERVDIDEFWSATTAQIGEAAVARARTAGGALPLNRAVQAARTAFEEMLAPAAEHGPPDPPAPHDSPGAHAERSTS